MTERLIAQISRLPLRSRTPQSGCPFGILCLDGGGICGAFTAAVQNYSEKATRRNIVEYFDLIASTSTGGILEIGLGLGMTVAEMVKFYVDEGSTVFLIDYLVWGNAVAGKKLERRSKRGFRTGFPPITGDSGAFQTGF